jgi:hypothetical protein
MVSVISLGLLAGSASAYYQINQLISPQLIVLKVFLNTKEPQIRALLPRPEDIRAELISYLTQALAVAGIAIAVDDSSIYGRLPEGVHPSNVVEIQVRIDLQSESPSISNSQVLGAASIAFERDGEAHVSALPFTLFSTENDAADVRAQCAAAAIHQLDQTVLAQLKAERK